MNNPWKSLCDNILPEYIAERNEVKLGNVGTTIIIEDYIMDNHGKYFNFETIKKKVNLITECLN